MLYLNVIDFCSHIGQQKTANSTITRTLFKYCTLSYIPLLTAFPFTLSTSKRIADKRKKPCFIALCLVDKAHVSLQYRNNVLVACSVKILLSAEFETSWLWEARIPWVTAYVKPWHKLVSIGWIVAMTGYWKSFSTWRYAVHIAKASWRKIAFTKQIMLE